MNSRFETIGSLAVLLGGILGSLLAISGCGTEPPPPTLPKLVAPKAPARVENSTLPSVKFVDVTESAGMNFLHVNGMKGAKLLPETMGSGVAFLDYDGDGDQDLFLVNSQWWPGDQPQGQPPPTQALYQNDGKGRFRDVTTEAKLDLSLFGQGVTVGDYDNDGDPDLFLTAVGGVRLLRNDKGVFSDVTKECQVEPGSGWFTSAAFFDLENDGDLDLFVCRYVEWSAEFDRAQNFQLTGAGRAYGPPTAFKGTLCLLLRNDGGRFTDVSETSGVQVRTLEQKVSAGKALGVAPFDIDDDGLVDLAVANDTVPNFLFHNRGGGKFDEIGLTSGIAFDQFGSARGAMGIDWGDFKNDGSLGLAIGNFANEMTALYVSDSPTSLLFSDLANVYGLGAPSQPPLKFGLFFFDYDLDGRLDLLSANGHLESDIAKVQASQSYKQSAQLFWNSGQPGRALFTLVGPEVAGPDLFRPMVGRGSAFADIDGDGDLDVVLTANGGPAKLFRNDGGNANHWLRIQLRGRKSNRDGIGARVALKAGELTSTRQLFPAKSYLSAMELPLTFGLGAEKSASLITVQWPSGSKTELRDVPCDRFLILDEERGLESP